MDTHAGAVVSGSPKVVETVERLLILSFRAESSNLNGARSTTQRSLDKLGMTEQPFIEGLVRRGRETIAEHGQPSFVSIRVIRGGR